MSTTSRITISLLLLVGCAAEEPELPVDSSSAEVLGEAGTAFAIAKGMWEVQQMLLDDSLSPEDLYWLQSQVNQLRRDVDWLMGVVTELIRRVDALEAETRSTRARDQYGKIETALFMVTERPGEAWDASNRALEAAFTLDDDTMFDFPYHGRTRFDPRFATPSFVTAVETWLAIRTRGEIPMTETSREQLRKFTYRLWDVAWRSWQSVSCDAVQETLEIECGRPGSGCVKRYCRQYWQCYDAILDTTSWYETNRWPGQCPYQRNFDGEKSRSVAWARYVPGVYDDLANAWWAYANR